MRKRIRRLAFVVSLNSLDSPRSGKKNNLRNFKTSEFRLMIPTVKSRAILTRSSLAI